MSSVKWLWSFITFHRLAILGGGTIGIIFMASLFFTPRWRGYAMGDFLAGLQLVVDLCMVPITIFGFILLIFEFRKSEAKPAIDLFWNSNHPKEPPNYTKATLLHIPRPRIDESSEASRFQLMAINTGNVLARWYSIEVQFPKKLDGPRGKELDGKSAYWFALDKQESNSYIYRSDGEMPLYLENPFVLLEGHFMMDSLETYEDQYPIPYVIASDWGKPAKGTLWLQFAHPRIATITRIADGAATGAE